MKIYRLTQEPVPLLHKIAFILPLLSIVACIIATVLVTGQTVGEGTRVRTLEREYVRLVATQQEHEEVLASKQSLQHIREVAIQEGYVPMTQITYLELVRPVASR